jgi:hypothetical protein
MNPILIPALAALLSSPARAQSDDAPEGFIYNPRQVLEEDEWRDLEVEGELVRPQGMAFIETRRASFPSFIRLRTDFDAELADSVDEVR